MKSVAIFFCLFFYLPIFCQCDSLFESKVDKFSAKAFYSPTEAILVKSTDGKELCGVTFSKAKGAVEITMAFVLGGVNCFRGDDKVVFLFTDGSKYETLNRAGRNCDGSVFVKMGGALALKKAMNEFSGKVIDAVRFYNISSFTQIDFSEGDGENIKKYVNCLAALE